MYTGSKRRFWIAGLVLITIILLALSAVSALAVRASGDLDLPDGVVRWEDNCLICYYDEINGTQCYQCPEAKCTQIEDNPTLTPIIEETVVPTIPVDSTDTPHPTNTQVVTVTQESINTPEPTKTSETTITPVPTSTSRPTRTPKPACNQGRGNESEGCDPGNSNNKNPSNDERGQRPGDHGGRGK